MRKDLFAMLFLLLVSCSKNYYPWTTSNLPKWVKESMKYDENVKVELADFGPVNKYKPFLWCYKYKNVVVMYDMDKNGNIHRYTVWRNKRRE
jgi:Tfp pilus assembly protein PilP